MYTKWNHVIVLLIVAIILSVGAVGAVGAVVAGPNSQDNVWDKIDKSQLRQPGADSSRLPNAYEAFRLNKAALQALLARAPEEFSGRARSARLCGRFRRMDSALLGRVAIRYCSDVSRLFAYSSALKQFLILPEDPADIAVAEGYWRRRKINQKILSPFSCFCRM